MTMTLATNKIQIILSIPSPLHPAERSWKALATHPPRQGLCGRTHALLHRPGREDRPRQASERVWLLPDLDWEEQGGQELEGICALVRLPVVAGGGSELLFSHYALEIVKQISPIPILCLHETEV